MNEILQKNNEELYGNVQALIEESNKRTQILIEETNKKTQNLFEELNIEEQDKIKLFHKAIHDTSEKLSKYIQELSVGLNHSLERIYYLEEKMKSQETTARQRYHLVSQAMNRMNDYLEHGRPKTFKALLEYYISVGNFNSFYDNFDEAFSDEEQIKNWIDHVENDFSSDIEWSLNQISENEMYELEKTFDLLEDEYSKDIFVRLIAWKLIGFTKVKLLSTEQIREEEELSARKDEILLDKRDYIFDVRYKLNCFDLTTLGVPIKCYAIFESIVMDFVRNQYENDDVKLEMGDYVIDCGACWGDTALLFASKVGLNGRIISFEFVPSNIKIFEENMKMNSDISSIVSLVNYAVSDRTGECIEYIDDGTATSIDIDKMNMPGEVQIAHTITIDDYVEQNQIEKVDFIKMDIEGAEMAALLGCKKTIKRFNPKLAISIYHKKNDMWEIPQWIKQICPEYKLYIKHNSRSSLETILFAKV